MSPSGIYHLMNETDSLSSWDLVKAGFQICQKLQKTRLGLSASSLYKCVYTYCHPLLNSTRIIMVIRIDTNRQNIKIYKFSHFSEVPHVVQYCRHQMKFLWWYFLFVNIYLKIIVPPQGIKIKYKKNCANIFAIKALLLFHLVVFAVCFLMCLFSWLDSLQE